eukprot:CAMPEP_0115096408 /NCGR_PEP_ID=MMETSP0227-20121206/29703_1 /TAXON_ID=89957 /ORGANISM="Polarella glacialis, Strain CCMP 1383" /LENGTH=52 /DNA_ID=CAMNT_0002490131 /DNA_START=83 /DNA_END=241 /DNA_ORIENTATION=+
MLVCGEEQGTLKDGCPVGPPLGASQEQWDAEKNHDKRKDVAKERPGEFGQTQ